MAILNALAYVLWAGIGLAGYERKTQQIIDAEAAANKERGCLIDSAVSSQQK